MTQTIKTPHASFSIELALDFYPQTSPEMLTKRLARNRLEDEKRRLELMKGLSAELQQYEQDASGQFSEEEKPSVWQRIWKKICKPAAYLLILIGVMENGLGSYLFGETLLNLIPSITSPWVIAGSIAVTVISSILFLSFEAAQMKDMLGITDLSFKEARTFLHCRLHQISELKKLNAQLSDLHLVTKIPRAKYQQYATLAMRMNETFEAQRSSVKLNESVWRKLSFGLVTLFGVMMTLAGTYFMATQFITAVSAPLLGTPLGWILIAVMLVAGVCFYIPMQGRGMLYLVNPDRQHFETLQTEMKSFKTQTPQQFECLQTYHQRLVQHVSRCNLLAWHRAQHVTEGTIETWHRARPTTWRSAHTRTDSVPVSTMLIAK